MKTEDKAQVPLALMSIRSEPRADMYEAPPWRMKWGLITAGSRPTSADKALSLEENHE